MPQGSTDDFPIAQTIAPNSHVFVWGTAWYDDGITKDRRFTQFCHRYSAAVYNLAVKRSAKSSRTRFVVESDKARYHTSGNNAD